MAADSTPPLSAQVLEEFAAAAWAGQQAADELRELARAEHAERERERKRRWAEKQRILARIRRAHGIEERVCACGCGRVFPVMGYREDGGRPQKYATVGCMWRAVKRNIRKRILNSWDS